MCCRTTMCTIWHLVSSVFIYLMLNNVSGLLTSKFTRLKACTNINNYTLVLQDCADFQKSQSFLNCICLCTSNKNCSGVVRDSSNMCYFYKPCSHLDFVDACSLTTMWVYKQADQCGVGETFNTTLGACVCKLGWTGPDCSTAPTGCDDLITQSYPVGSYWVDIKNADGTMSTIFCEIIATGYRYHVFRNNGLVSHNKTFVEYVKGYKIDDSNFWIGLDNMNKYASNLGNKQIKMEAIFESDVVKAYWQNSGVGIDIPSNMYKISYTGTSNSASSSSGYTVSITNCLSGSGTPFSTWDSDHDGSASNLAAQAGAGWYFRSSLSCNPLGQLPSSGVSAGYMALPNLDMANGAYLSYFKYIVAYFY